MSGVAAGVNLYLQQAIKVLRELRPETLEARRGRWTGPEMLHDSPVAGPVFRSGGGLLLMVSPWDTDGTDAGLWFHASVSHASRMPTYDELTDIRDRFFRPSDTVLHVWPPRAEHYNLHPYCLHLWTPMDGSRPVPNLSALAGGV